MMMLILSRDAPTAHCANRVFEWFAASALLLMAMNVMLWPISIDEGIFRHISNSGFGPNSFAFFCFVIGMLRITGLYMIGTYPPACVILRAIGAAASAYLWTVMMMSALSDALSLGALSVMLWLMFCMVIAEVYSAPRAIHDGQSIAVNARARNA